MTYFQPGEYDNIIHVIFTGNQLDGVPEQFVTQLVASATQQRVGVAVFGFDYNMLTSVNGLLHNCYTVFLGNSPLMYLLESRLIYNCNIYSIDRTPVTDILETIAHYNITFNNSL